MPFLRRHARAALASTVLLTGWLGTLGSAGLLGLLFPPENAWPRAIGWAAAITLGLFFPVAAIADRAARRWPALAWATPLLLAAAATAAGLIAELAAGRFHPSFVLTYAAVGLMVGAVFCGYWVPLRMTNDEIRMTKE